ncbi:MAG: flavin reductase [Beijerinckiaceae bacterium]|jgi:flavin reductase
MTDRAGSRKAEAATPLDAKVYRDAMARLGAAVHIVTTDGPGGRAGFTASAVCSVTDQPPTLLVCLNRSTSVHKAFAKNRIICVNTLAIEHEALSTLFGGGGTTMDERFAAATWSTLSSGAPVLDGALLSFDCRVAESIAQGTHEVFFCEVLAIKTTDKASGLFYFDRRYRVLEA